MARTNTKIGDIFSVKLEDNKKRFFQLVTFDSTQLDSDVVRVFKKVYPSDSKPTLSEILSDDIDFYVHCVTKFGLKMGLWEQIGNTSEVGDYSDVLFRGTSDYGVRAGQEPVKVSNNWYVWRINDKEFTVVGKLENDNRDAYIGLVINPVGILEMLRGNKYPVNYPDFE